MRIYLALVVLTLAFVPACGNKETTAKKEAASTGAASEGALCDHGVLEAICTKHNPKLISIFKSKGDYCEEHGFPMSVCPVHHPERGGRPAADVAADKAPPDGTKVRLKTPETARLAGIKTVKAEKRPGGARLEALASITYDASKWAQVNARAAGVVREVKVDVGTTVKAGAPIAVIESASVGADRSRMRAAGSRVAVAEANYKREKELLQQGIAAQKDVLAAQQEIDAARAEQSAAGASVSIVGKGAGANGYVVTAPIAGVVTKRNITIGHMVGSDDQVLFEIVDTSSMRAEIEIPETELRRVRVGQEVVITSDALPGSEFKGTLEYIAPEVARETRTTKARVSLANPDGSLRANMFGRAQIALGDTEATVIVPRMAVQRVADVDLVFVKLTEGEYEVRRVKTGVRENDRVEITSGLKVDEDVVTDGSFMLKTETLKGSIGAGCCE
ncbi:MAG: efflux RND transporter periplasmic adaptor subunit [Kofleriaceae bacterium]